MEAFAGGATSFAVGDDGRRSSVLWPSRFRSASADALNGINIVTADGQLRVTRTVFGSTR